jgi:hypothetical protein
MSQKKNDKSANVTPDLSKIEQEKIAQIFKDFTMQRTQDVFGQDFINRHGFTKDNITMKDVIEAKSKEFKGNK